MKKIILLCMILISCYFGLFGNQLIYVHAEEKYKPVKTRYYSSIQVQQGESLWEIANRLSTDSELSVDTYIDELIRINGLRSETIHAGEYLTVVIFGD